MLKAERRGEYGFSFVKDALVVSNDEDERVAMFVDYRHGGDVIGIAVDLPNSAGTRTYAVGFDWLLDHLRKLEPTAQQAEPAGRE
jgi:hypothetical protein